MKKSLVAVAVAGAVGAPMSAAQAAEAYGFVFAAVDTVSGVEGGGIPNIFTSAFANPQEETFMGDTAESRFGFRGSEDLGNGMTGSYNLEFGLVTESINSGSVNEDSVPQMRLAWVALGGDWGEIKAGTQWSVAYEYMGWNVFRSRGHGGAAWYRMFNGGFGSIGDGSFTLTPDNPSGLRIDNALAYTWGGGGYSSDPFTFTVEARLDGLDNTGTSADTGEEAFDQISLGAQGTIGDFTINGFLSQASRDQDGAREPSIAAIGGRWTNGPTHVGVAIMSTDPDGENFGSGAGDNEGTPTGFIAEATHDFGNGWSGMLMLGTVDGDDAIHDMDSNIFVQADYAFSSRTHFQVEIENATLSSTDATAFEAATADDAEETVISLGLFHSF